MDQARQFRDPPYKYAFVYWKEKHLNSVAGVNNTSLLRKEGNSVQNN